MGEIRSRRDRCIDKDAIDAGHAEKDGGAAAGEFCDHFAGHKAFLQDQVRPGHEHGEHPQIESIGVKDRHRGEDVVAGADGEGESDVAGFGEYVGAVRGDFLSECLSIPR